MRPTIAGKWSIPSSTARWDMRGRCRVSRRRSRNFMGKPVVIDGISRFILRDGLIAEYRESVNGGVAMAQLGVEPERMTKVFRRWTGWLTERPETVDYLARPKASRARTARVKT